MHLIPGQAPKALLSGTVIGQDQSRTSANAVRQLPTPAHRSPIDESRQNRSNSSAESRILSIACGPGRLRESSPPFIPSRSEPIRSESVAKRLPGRRVYVRRCISRACKVIASGGHIPPAETVVGHVSGKHDRCRIACAHQVSTLISLPSAATSAVTRQAGEASRCTSSCITYPLTDQFGGELLRRLSARSVYLRADGVNIYCVRVFRPQY